MTITLVAFEALAISTVMPDVAKEFGEEGTNLYGWAFTAFFLGTLIGIVAVGGIVDRGLAAPFLGGLGLFAIGLLIGGLAPSMQVLVLARFIQGLGAGAIPPIAYVAIARSMPEELRPRMFAWLSTAWAMPGVMGPAIAGIVGDTIGWRAVFLGLLPLIVDRGGRRPRRRCARSRRRPRRSRRRPRRPPRSAGVCRWPCSSTARHRAVHGGDHDRRTGRARRPRGAGPGDRRCSRCAG